MQFLSELTELVAFLGSSAVATAMLAPLIMSGTVNADGPTEANTTDKQKQPKVKAASAAAPTETIANAVEGTPSEPKVQPINPEEVIKTPRIRNKNFSPQLKAIEQKMISTEKLMKRILNLQNMQMAVEKDLANKKRDLYNRTFTEYLLELSNTDSTFIDQLDKETIQDIVAEMFLSGKHENILFDYEDSKDRINALVKCCGQETPPPPQNQQNQQQTQNQTQTQTQQQNQAQRITGTDANKDLLPVPPKPVPGPAGVAPPPPSVPGVTPGNIPAGLPRKTPQGIPALPTKTTDTKTNSSLLEKIGVTPSSIDLGKMSNYINSKFGDATKSILGQLTKQAQAANLLIISATGKTQKLFSTLYDKISSEIPNILNFAGNKITNDISLVAGFISALAGILFSPQFVSAKSDMTKTAATGGIFDTQLHNSDSMGFFKNLSKTVTFAKGGAADFWSLAAVAAAEDVMNPQGRADVAQSLYNRALAGIYPGGKSIKNNITASGQYAVTFDNITDWKNITNKQTANLALRRSGKPYAPLDVSAKNIMNPSLRANARKFVGGRPDFLGETYKKNMKPDLGDITRGKTHNFFGWMNNYKGKNPAPAPDFSGIKYASGGVVNSNRASKLEMAQEKFITSSVTSKKEPVVIPLDPRYIQLPKPTTPKQISSLSMSPPGVKIPNSDVPLINRRTTGSIFSVR